MPIFEFRCEGCGHKFATLVGMVASTSGGDSDVKCPKCASPNVGKLVSRPAKFRSEDARIDEVADRLESTDDYGSGTEMRGLMREMGKAMDDDVADDMEEMFEADMEGKLDDD